MLLGVCDEAHRIRKMNAIDPDRPQIDELTMIARFSVFFIDAVQAVKRVKIGNATSTSRGWSRTPTACR